MERIEQRLSGHLGERAAAIEPIELRVEHVMSEGRRKKNGRALLVGGAAAVALIAVGVAAVAVFGHRTRDTSVKSAVVPITLGLDPATKVEPNFDWTVATSSSPAAQFGSAAYWAGASSNGLSNYTFGTVPHDADEPREQQLFSTADGVDYQTAGAPFDPWISDLDSSRPSAVYAIGTVPDDLAFTYQTGVSLDDGATWTTSNLPLDLGQVRADLGGLSTVGAQVVASDTDIVAIVQTVGFTCAGPGCAPIQLEGHDTQYGVHIADDGIEIYGAPDDLEAVGERECPPGWPLVQGPAREFVPEGQEAATATTTFGIPRPGVAEWHCESPDRSEPDLWLDPARIHGDVVEVVPFDQAGLADDTLKALRMAVRVFHSTDGTNWSEVEIDAGGGTRTPPTLLWTGSTFALRANDAEGGELWLSPDGQQWRQATAPDGNAQMALGALPDGSLLFAGTRLGELVAYTSRDGNAWHGVSLDGLTQLDGSWRIGQFQLVTDAAGASLMVSAGQDVFATVGAEPIDHGRFQLQLTDGLGTADLLDGNGDVIDRFDGTWSGIGSTGVNGWLQSTDNGNVTVVDPTTGEVLDVFTSSEIQAISETVWQSPQAQQLQGQFANGAPSAWWALDTVDGVHWGLTRLDLGTNAGIAALGQAGTAGHSYRLWVGGGSAAVVGTRRTT
jgi:hypothetical protein